jgi:hypothetical protein
LALLYDEQLRPQLLAALKAQTNMQEVQLSRLGDLLADLCEIQSEQVAAQKSVAETLDKIYRQLNAVSKPGPASLVVTSENGSMLNFKITPDWATADADVVSAEVSVAIDGGSPIVVTVARDAEAEDAGFAGPDGASVVVGVTYIDDATPTPNRSSLTEKTYTLADTIAPAAPGEPVLTVTSET